MRKHSIIAFAACAALFGLALSTASAEDELTGWRGNWTGKFPKANPPTEWGKVSKLMAGLRCQAEKPKDDKPSGVPIHYGALTQWLVLGPLPSAGGEDAVDEDFVGDETKYEPDLGKKIKGLAWKKVETAGSILDFTSLFAEECKDTIPVPFQDMPLFKAHYTAYAHTYIFSAVEGSVNFRFHIHRRAKIYVNGTLIYPGGRKIPPVKLKKGWNRFLCKVVNNPVKETPKNKWDNQHKYKRACQWCGSKWYMDAFMRTVWPYETETKNIVWSTRLPSWSASGPIIVGDKIFLMSEPGDLVCLDKKSGKIDWLRSITFFDTVDQKDKKENPVFKEVAPLAEKLSNLNAAYSAAKSPDQAVAKEQQELYKKIGQLMRKVDGEKYYGRCQHGFCMPTPVSDGKHIYTWMGNGLGACFDLEGNRKWTASATTDGHQEHGFPASPVLAGGNLVVFRRDLAALDANTGKLVWKTDIRKDKRSNSKLLSIFSSLVSFNVGKTPFVFIYGQVVRVSDGSIVWEKNKWRPRGSPTPIIENGFMYTRGPLTKLKLPVSADNISLGTEWQIKTFNGGIPSPVYHKGLIYTVGGGKLCVVDDEAKKVVYKKQLGVGKNRRSSLHHRGSVLASLVLAGEHIYMFGVDGTTVVFELGREYKEVARNKIEDLTNPGNWREKGESFPATPVAEGKYLYVRGDKYLYCIGEKQ